VLIPSRRTNHPNGSLFYARISNRNKEAGSKKVFEIVSSIRYDPEDALDRFIDDCTKPNDRERDSDADEEPTTKLQFLEATGARFAAEVEVRPFQDEVIEARNGARKRNLDLNALLRETRDLLNHPAVCAGLQRLARALYQARARELSIVELENHSQVGAWVREKLKPARDERAELIELCGAQAERLLECTFGDDLA
jgi:hypothetical protein